MSSSAPAHDAELAQALADPAVDLVALEQDKIKGAVRTDFILSAEIIVITLGTVAAASFGLQVAVLAGIAVVMRRLASTAWSPASSSSTTLASISASGRPASRVLSGTAFSLPRRH